MKERWSWKRWLERLESSPLSDEQKALVRRLHGVAHADGRRGKRAWWAFWQIETFDGGRMAGGTDLRAALFEAQKLRLCTRTPGGDDWLAVLGPPLPPAKSIRLTPTQRKALACLRAGWKLAFVRRPGWATQRDDTKTRWLWHTFWHSYRCNAPHKAAAALLELGLIERDGTLDGNWRDPHILFYRVAEHLLYAVKNLPEPQESLA